MASKYEIIERIHYLKSLNMALKDPEKLDVIFQKVLDDLNSNNKEDDKDKKMTATS